MKKTSKKLVENLEPKVYKTFGEVWADFMAGKVIRLVIEDREHADADRMNTYICYKYVRELGTILKSDGYLWFYLEEPPDFDHQKICIVDDIPFDDVLSNQWEVME
jgi:hypothetical protein